MQSRAYKVAFLYLKVLMHRIALKGFVIYLPGPGGEVMFHRM